MDIEITQDDIAQWVKAGYFVDPDNMTAYKRVPSLSGSPVYDTISVWLPQWKASRANDDDEQADEPPF